MLHLRWLSLGLLVLLAAVSSLPSVGGAATPGKVTEQKEKQKQVQAETDRLVRRIETMIRVLEYNRLDQTTQKQMLDEVGKTLGGLSREQMTALLAALERASKDGADRDVELKKARGHHEEIVLALKGLLSRFDAIRGLDQAADRLDKMSRDLVEQWLALQQITHESANVVQSRRGSTIEARLERVKTETTFVRKDFSELLLQLQALSGKLPAEQSARAGKVAQTVKDEKMIDRFGDIVKNFQTTGYPQTRHAAWLRSADAQWIQVGHLLELAGILRPLPERGTVLREARHRVEKSIDDLLALIADVKNPPKLEGGDINKDERNRQRRDPDTPETPVDAKLIQGKTLADHHGWLEYETQITRRLLAPQVGELAAKLQKAEAAIWKAHWLIRPMKDTAETTKEQQTALARLREVKAELDRLVAEDDRARTDPLVNLKDSLARVEKLFRDQKDVRGKTTEAIEKKTEKKLPDLTSKQEEMARQTEAVKNELNNAARAEKALETAAKAMDNSAEKLRKQQGKESVAKQQQALESLEEARKELAQKVEETEKRRDEIAKLEDARKKVGELIEQEKKIGKEAEKASAKAANDLAKKQGEVTPPTRELAREVQPSAPRAAKNLDESAKAMEGAKKDLEKSEMKPAAHKAADATAKLMEADKALAKALEQKKAEEAAAQAAMQPNRIDPQAAAQQIAKALEQAQMAQQAAGQAAQPQGQPMEKKADLAALQKQVAEQAAKVDAAEAKQPAMEAAQALSKGELGKAMEAQKNAMARLEQATQKGEKSGQKGEKTGEKTPAPMNAQNAAQLAQAQKTLMEATAQLAKSQNATQAAMAALAQAQAQAPQAVQNQLGQAGKQLAQAGQKLQAADPASAGQAQGKAAAQLSQALATLQNAVAQGQGMGMGEGTATAQGMGMSEGMGQGQGMGKSAQPAAGQERNQSKGSGERLADGKSNTERGTPGESRGTGQFINLPPRQRELLRQALTEKLPPEYAAMIQQYFINIARGKAATSGPAKP